MKFSITVPAYKAQFLKECIDSILAQTYPNFELIIVNDASPEDLDLIVNAYSDNRIRYYKNKVNCGAVNVVDNWNKCLEYATGDYLICMGDDDMLAPDCLTEYLQLMKCYPDLDIYHGRTEIINEHTKFYMLQEARPKYESVYSLIWHRWKGRAQFIGDFLFRVQALKEKGGFYKLPLAWASDDISANIMALRSGIANTNHIVFRYRMNPYTLSESNNANIKLLAIEKEEHWYHNFLNMQVPEQIVDRMYLQMLQKDFKKHFLKKKISTISVDLACHASHLLFLFSKRKSIGLNFKMLLYAIIDSVKIKKARKL